MDQDDIDLELALSALLAETQGISSKIDAKTEDEKLTDKNIRQDSGLTEEEKKKVEQTTAIVKKALAKKPEKKKEDKKDKSKPPTAQAAAPKQPKKPQAKKAAVKKLQAKATKPPKAQPPPIAAVKPAVAKKKQAKRAPAKKPQVKKEKKEPQKSAAENARIFSEIFIKMWREQVVEPQQEQKIKTVGEENKAPEKPQPIQQEKNKSYIKPPDKFLDTSNWGNVIKTGVAAGPLAWGFGKEMGELLVRIDEEVGDIKQQQQMSFTNSNLIQHRRMSELALKPDVTAEELEKERQFQIKELERDKEFYTQFKNRETWWLPASMDADTQAAQGLERQIQKRAESIERFNSTIAQLRKDLEERDAKKEKRAPRKLPDAPKLEPIDQTNLVKEAMKNVSAKFGTSSFLHDYIIKDGKITPFDNKDNILSIKESGPFDGLFDLTKKIHDQAKANIPNIIVEPTPIDLSGLAKHFAATAVYLKQMVDLNEKNTKILQAIAAKPGGGSTVVNTQKQLGNIAGSIAAGADSRSLYRNSAYSINVPGIS